jgi:hypothetical protein
MRVCSSYPATTEAYSVTERQIPAVSYWGAAFAVEENDLDYLYTLLLENETPLTTDEMVQSLIQRRCQRELEALERRQLGAVVYMPKETYTVGQQLVFQALQFVHGTVAKIRPGRNPVDGEFDVITVEFSNDLPTREFAARFPSKHKLNQPIMASGEEEFRAPDAVFAEHGAAIAEKLQACLFANPDIVKIAGRWFPRALLTPINVGHLNLAEAVLDMAGGGPLPTEAVLKEIGLPDSLNPRLQAFSLNYALQEDERFDEVGPSGEVLWHLHKLEPAAVQVQPRRLVDAGLEYERAKLTPPLLALETELEDELTPAGGEAATVAEVFLTLTFPHFRVGTLPLSARLAKIFPTAFEAPRIRFMLVDGNTGEKFPGWVVRSGRYVYGLEEWYKQNEMIVGAQLTVRPGDAPGEVVVKADKRRITREWVRTAATAPDGRLVFNMQRRPISVAYDELMVIAVDNPAAMDDAWLKSDRTPFHRLVADIFRELAKLNPQSAVHAKTLYTAVNVARRVAPGAIFTELLARPWYAHVGDAYWRFNQSRWTE